MVLYLHPVQKRVELGIVERPGVDIDSLTFSTGSRREDGVEP